MYKFVIILVVAAIIESMGVAILGWGLKELPPVREISVGEVFRIAKSAVTNSKFMSGMALETIFFGCLLYMMSTKDISLVWPLTSLGFVFTTLAAHFLLNERVSATRWAGVLLISIGAALTAYSEKAKDSPAPPPRTSATLGSQ
jgi:drug/metabolite transporter (DMT)-like permease